MIEAPRMPGSPLPLLDVAELVRSGVASGKRQSARVGLNEAISLESGAVTSTAAFGAAEHMPSPRVTLRSSPRGRGVSWYFTCPSCSRNCSYLVLSQGWTCTICYVEDGLTFTKPHRRALVYEAKALSRLSKVVMRATARDTSPPERSFAARGEATDAPAPAQAATDEERFTYGDLTMDAAIEFGSDATDFPPARKLATQPPMWWDYWSDDVAHTRPAAPALTTATPALDLRVIIRRLLPKQGKWRAYFLGWPRESTGGHPLLLFLDRRDLVPRLAIARRADDAEAPQWQRLKLVVVNKRLRLVCPVTRCRHDLLYWRNGMFASPLMQRLVQPSQRAAGGARRHRPAAPDSH